MPRCIMSDTSSGGVSSMTSLVAEISALTDFIRASLMSESVTITSRGSPVIISRPLIAASNPSPFLITEPMDIFTSSAVFSPSNNLNSSLAYWIMSWLSLSPAILIFLAETIPPKEITAISVVPPPISTIMIVDIGGGTTDIAVISLGGIVSAKNMRIAGDKLNQDIIQYAKDEFKLL